MPRRTIKTRPATPPSSWAVLVVDGRPIRDKARREYERTLRDLDRTRQQIEQFETKDRPLFRQWVNQHFGALLTEIRQTMHALEAKRALLMEVDQEAFWTDSSHARAYARVMYRRSKPARETPPPRPASSEAEQDDPQSEEDRLDDEFFSFIEDELNSQSHRGEPVSKESPARLKELYRALARRLHPDIQGSMTPQQKDWWHQAQAAYQAGDVEQLEVILTLCEIGERGSTAKTSVSLIMRITRQVRSSLRTLKAQLASHRRDPAWNFSTRPDRTPLRDRIESSLRQEYAEIRRTLQAIEAQLDVWSRQGRPADVHPHRRRRACPF